jgi:hypothetical protein
MVLASQVGNLGPSLVLSQNRAIVHLIVGSRPVRAGVSKQHRPVGYFARKSR